jgi:hypothetical protein
VASHLSFLVRMSWPDRAAEARRRGMPGPESLDQDSLPDAIRARKGRGGGPLSRTRALLGLFIDTVRAALPGVERRSERPPPLGGEAWRSAGTFVQQPAPVAPPALPAGARAILENPAFHGVCLVEDGALGLVWRIEPERIEAARLVVPETEPTLRVRTVRVRWPEEAPELIVERLDIGPVAGEGAIGLGVRREGERVVAAVGIVAADGGFVSIEHATRP